VLTFVNKVLSIHTITKHNQFFILPLIPS